MPKAMEKSLKSQARKKGLSKKKTNSYVYGTMCKAGWKPRKK